MLCGTLNSNRFNSGILLKGFCAYLNRTKGKAGIIRKHSSYKRKKVSAILITSFSQNLNKAENQNSSELFPSSDESSYTNYYPAFASLPNINESPEKFSSLRSYIMNYNRVMHYLYFLQVQVLGRIRMP